MSEITWLIVLIGASNNGLNFSEFTISINETLYNDLLLLPQSHP